MSIQPTVLSSIFNFLSPENVDRLNARMWTAAKNDSQVWLKLRPLLRAGAQPDALDKDGNTLLNLLCSEGQFIAANKLLENGVKLGPPNKEGMTPLMNAAVAGCATLVTDLIKAGADINECTPKGENALLVLVNYKPGGAGDTPRNEEKRCRAMKVLLEAGLPLTDYMRMRIYNFATYLAPAAPEIAPVRALRDSMEKEDPKETLALLQQGVTPDAPVKFGDYSVLGLAAQRGDMERLNAALAAGANIDLPSGSSKMTPVQFATLAGHKEAFLALLDAGAKTDLPCAGYGADPLLKLAKDSKSPGMLKFVADELHERGDKTMALGDGSAVRTMKIKFRKNPGPTS